MHLWAVAIALAGSAAAPKAPAPRNLAPKATVQASSEFSKDYVARRAVDGQVPAAMGHADVGKAWAVNGATHRGGAEFTLRWSEAVLVAEIVYYGRTAWEWEENWKDYAVYLDGAPKPAARGRLRPGHGPQRIRLSKAARAKTLTLKFLSSYGGSNPGASEIQVYPVHPPEALLGKFSPPARTAAPGRAPMPPIEESPELAAELKAGKLGFDRLVLIQRHEINPTHVYTYHCEGFRAGGGLFVYAPGRGELKRLVDSPRGQIIDCDLSYDGQTVLFSWRPSANDSYHLHTIRVDGTGLKRLTDGPHHNYNACWLPDGGIALLSTRAPQFAYCWHSPVGVLYRMQADGSRVRRLSANYLNDFTPTVMSDGRIIYGRWEYVDKPAIPIQSLWTINPDGTGLAVFYGNRVLSPATFMEARSIPGSGKVLCVLTSHNGPARGAIGTVDHAIGVNDQDAIDNLTPEINIGRVDRGDGNRVRGPYENPYPLDERYFLVSRRGTVLVRDYAGRRQAVVIRPREGLGFYSAQPVRRRARPPVIPSHLPTGERADGAGEWATVFCQDVYNGLEPHVRRGEVRQICVVQELPKGVRIPVSRRAFGFQFPVISCGATYAGKKIWGYAEVAADGSACFRVPANQPIYFMALDAEGRAVQRMRSFTHFMPGEVQGCVGCHEPRDETSRLSSPRSLARPPQRLQEPEWSVRGFDYAAIVQPVLDRHCVTCHAGPQPPKAVDLSGDKTDFFNVSYDTLASGPTRGQRPGPYTNWIPTYNGREANILQITPKTWGSPRSRLAELILSGHRDAQGMARVRMPSPARRRVLAWIDLNVPYYGTTETAYPEQQGCRRLYPADLDRTLADVARRRCASCHKGGRIPRKPYTRITNPRLNRFLLAPLAKAAGGTEACGKPVFESPDDPDYQALLKTFEPIRKRLRERPRMDMPGAAPAGNVSRSCQ